jgi:hypothetical protein
MVQPIHNENAGSVRYGKIKREERIGVYSPHCSNRGSARRELTGHSQILAAVSPP